LSLLITQLLQFIEAAARFIHGVEVFPCFQHSRTALNHRNQRSRVSASSADLAGRGDTILDGPRIVLVATLTTAALLSPIHCQVCLSPGVVGLIDLFPPGARFITDTSTPLRHLKIGFVAAGFFKMAVATQHTLVACIAHRGPSIRLISCHIHTHPPITTPKIPTIAETPVRAHPGGLVAYSVGSATISTTNIGSKNHKKLVRVGFMLTSIMLRRDCAGHHGQQRSIFDPRFRKQPRFQSKRLVLLKGHGVTYPKMYCSCQADPN